MIKWSEGNKFCWCHKYNRFYFNYIVSSLVCVCVCVSLTHHYWRFFCTRIQKTSTAHCYLFINELCWCYVKKENFSRRVNNFLSNCVIIMNGKIRIILSNNYKKPDVSTCMLNKKMSCSENFFFCLILQNIIFLVLLIIINDFTLSHILMENII